MNKIKWKHFTEYSLAKVGGINLSCFRIINTHGRYKWYCQVSGSTFNVGLKTGPMRSSITKAKEDAVRVARNMLLDYQAGLAIEMKNFDLDPCFCE